VAPASPNCNPPPPKPSNISHYRQGSNLPPPSCRNPLRSPPSPTMARSAQGHMLIEPTTLATLKKRLRGERMQLQSHQGQIRRSALNGARKSDGWAKFSTGAAKSDALPEDLAASQNGSQNLETQIADRTAHVITSLADARRDLAKLRGFITYPRVWQRRLEYGKRRITEAMRCNFPFHTPQGGTADNSMRDHGRALPPPTSFPFSSLGGPTVGGRGRSDGDGDDDGTGPWIGGAANGPHTRSLITFQEAESELKSLLDQPKQPRSLRSATDDALERLRECLDLRARAARGMVPPAESVDSFDMCAASKALAWAQLWDSNDILGTVKFQVSDFGRQEYRANASQMATKSQWRSSGSFSCKHGTAPDTCGVRTRIDS
jgi:hypothetical protein